LLRQLRTPAGVIGDPDRDEPLVLTRADRLDDAGEPLAVRLREASFAFSLGRHCEELRLEVREDASAAEIARAAVHAARMSMRKRGFSEADLKHLQVTGGEWL
jgi:hypothetical protein